MSSPDLSRISRFLALVLRHRPDQAGLTLDAGGWVPVSDLLKGLRAKGYPATRAMLEELVCTDDKQRYTFSAHGAKIRANQGHSIPVNLGLSPENPPEHLFHGTVAPTLAAIRAEGLTRRQRHHVHLSADRGTAAVVGGRRRGRPVVLTVRAGDMARAGHAFYRSTNGVWLTDAVPPGFIDWDGLAFGSENRG